MNRLRYRLCALISLWMAMTLWACSSWAQSGLDQQCLSCHKDASLRQPMRDGPVRSLCVNPADWAGDIHHRKGMTCVDCHEQATPSSHPVGGLGTPNCERCHGEACEEMARTVHVLPHGTKSLPACYHCHTRHAVRTKDDPNSSVTAENLVSTCSPCHLSQSKKMSWLDALVFFRIDGHRKENISGIYDRARCNDCHFQDGAHGQPGAVSQRCGACHGDTSRRTGLLSPSIHTASLLSGTGRLAALRTVFLLLMAVVAGWAVHRAWPRGGRNKDTGS